MKQPKNASKNASDTPWCASLSKYGLPAPIAG